MLRYVILLCYIAASRRCLLPPGEIMAEFVNRSIRDSAGYNPVT